MQVGLDGIRMLDPNTSRTLRIYPLETVTRCDVSNFCSCGTFIIRKQFHSFNISVVDLVTSVSGIRSFYLCLLVKEFSGC
jgi:hypothetical protein